MKRVVKIAALLGALGAAFLLGQSASNLDRWWAPEKDALAAAPQNHKLLFENDDVRVLEVTVPPGVREPLHAPVSECPVLHLRCSYEGILARCACRGPWPQR
jgi:hypothetical protein